MSSCIHARQVRLSNSQKAECLNAMLSYKQRRTGRSGIRADARGAAASRGPANHACRVRAAASSQRGPTLSPGLLSCIYSVKQLQISHLSLNPYSCYIIGNKSVFIPDMSVYNILQTWLPYIGLHYFVALFNQMFKKCIVRN